MTRFKVRTNYLSRFKREVVGSSVHEELWVPAEELEEFNSNIIGTIQVIAEYKG